MSKVQPYSAEFREEAVRLLRTSGRSVPQLADELGVSPPQSSLPLPPGSGCPVNASAIH